MQLKHMKDDLSHSSLRPIREWTRFKREKLNKSKINNEHIWGNTSALSSKLLMILMLYVLRMEQGVTLLK